MDQISQANFEYYKDGEEVDSYLNNVFHKERTALVLSILERFFSSTGRRQGIELAAGSGTIAKKIQDMGADIVACDISDHALLLAQAKGLKTLRFNSSEHFPLDDRSQDFVYAGELIEHLFDTRLFLAECFRILRPGGVLILTTPNLVTLKDRFRFLLGHSPRQVSPFHRYLYLHIRPFTRGTLEQGLLETGFQNVKIISQCVEIPLYICTLRLKWLARLFPAWGGSLIAVCFRS